MLRPLSFITPALHHHHPWSLVTSWLTSLPLFLLTLCSLPGSKTTFFLFLPSTPLYQGSLVKITISQCLSCKRELYSLCSSYHCHPWNICYIPTSTNRNNAEVRSLLAAQHHDEQWRGRCGEKWILTPFGQVSLAFVIPQLLLCCFSLSLLLTVIKVCEDPGLRWMLDSGQTVLSAVWILAIFKLIYIGWINVLQAWHFNHTAVTAPVRPC